MNNLEEAMRLIEIAARKSSKNLAWGYARQAAEQAGVEVHKSPENNYPDLERLERDIRSALGSQVIIVTRHAPLVQWLAAHGITGPVLAHVKPEDVAGKDVFGVLPMWLAAFANSITEVSMPALPLEARARVGGGDYTTAEMDAWGATMHRYVVRPE